jgi:hypothetical protein
MICCSTIDWGDGHVSPGTIQFVGGTPGHFTVQGSNTYAEEGQYNVKVTVFDTQDPSLGKPLVLQQIIKVNDQPLQAVANPTINLVEGANLGLGRQVASFLDPNPGASAGDYIVKLPGQAPVPGVLIDYGDGKTDVGTVVADGDTAGLFHVLTPATGAGHGFTEGTHDLQVQVLDEGGAQLTTHTTLQVSDAPLTLQGTTPLTEIALQPFQATLGTFIGGSTSTLVHDTAEQVTVDWGDGTTTAGSVVDNGDGTFSVRGGHTYQAPTNADTPNSITVTVKDPGGQTLTFNNTAAVQNAAAILPTALPAELDQLQAGLNGKIFSNPLPLIGTALAGSPAGQIVGTFESALKDGAQASSGGDFSQLVSTITTELGNLLQVLPDGKKVDVTTEGTHGHIVEVDLAGQTTVASTRVDLDLGLPGLPFHFLQGNAAINLNIGFDLHLQFGIHDNGTVFIQTKPDTNPNALNPLGFLVDVSASILPGSNVTADLGLFQLTLTQGSDPNKASALTVGLSTGFTSNLSVGAVDFQTPQLTGGVKVNARTALTLLSSPALPGLSADFTLDWQFHHSDPTASKPLGDTPLIKFDKVQLDLGGFLSGAVSPVLGAVQKYTEPLEPLAQFLITKVPLISNVTDLFGLPPATLASLLGGSAGSTLNAFAGAIETINSIQVPANGSITINLGSFTVSDPRAKDPSGNPVTNAAVNLDSTLHKTAGVLGTASSATGGFFSKLETSARFHFPILDNPLQAFNVFLGKPVDLVTLDLSADVKASFNAGVVLPIIPGVLGLNASFSGGVDLSAGATFALDTQALVTGNLLDSLAVRDAHIDLSVNLGAAAGLSVLIASADLAGQLTISDSAKLLTKDTHDDNVTGTDLLNNNVTFAFGSPQVKGELDFVVQLVTGLTLFNIKLASFQVTLFNG